MNGFILTFARVGTGVSCRVQPHLGAVQCISNLHRQIGQVGWSNDVDLIVLLPNLVLGELFLARKPMASLMPTNTGI